ncbi:MAG: CRTAC1 family protein [Phycisphaeraceae bacterium]|nr:CRTAC1 family protein [Phycisphaeraceae bacterium]
MAQEAATTQVAPAAGESLNPAPERRPVFVDRTADFGLTIGSGPVAWGDINNDGWPDLYAGGAVWINNLGMNGNTPPAFTRIAAPGNGLIADLNNDGIGDLVSISPIAIYIGHLGEDGMRFDKLALPELPETVCRGAVVGDFNNDGFLDVYFGGYENWEKQVTYPSFMLLSTQGAGFSLRIMTSEHRSRGVTACDFDEDGDLDIYVSNYRLQPNLLWVNDGSGDFSDKAEHFNVIATSEAFRGGHSIGACWGDFDNDGHFDLFAGNFAHVDSRGDQPKNRFLRSRGPTHGWTFEDLAECGVWYQESYASPACADFDNDTRLDLFFTTVYADASFGHKNYPVLYRNTSGDDAWSFADVTDGSGLEKLPPTYQAAWADVDGDGRLDLVTAGRLYMNVGTSDAQYLGVRLQGDGTTINKQAVGAQARIALPDGQILSRQVELGTGEGNANSPILHFGLGSFTGPVTVAILWPNGKTQSVVVPAVGRTIDVQYADESEDGWPE